MSSVVGMREHPAETALGERLRALRHQRGWSQVEMALRAGINKSRVSRFERGQEQPSLSTLAWLAWAFGIEDMGELMGGLPSKEMRL